MEGIIDYLSWPPTYKLKRHRRARHVNLRPSKEHGLEITVPYRFSQKHIPAILEENKAWILKELAVMHATRVMTAPDSIDFPVLGESWRIRYMQRLGRMRLVESPVHELCLLGAVSETHYVCQKLIVWCKTKAKLQLPRMLETVSRGMGIAYTKVDIRDQKTRWGSCSVDKNINLNYRLIFLPETLARHIMVHELCHTVYLNHSEKFWALVAKHDPAWKENRIALKYADKHIPVWL